MLLPPTAAISYLNSHYRTLVMEPYNVRVQMGSLISRRSKQRLREGNGGPEDTPYCLGQNLDLNPRPLTPGCVLHCTPLCPTVLLWAGPSLLYSTSFSPMIYSTNSPVSYLQPCMCFSHWWVCELPWARLRCDTSLLAKGKAVSKYAPGSPQWSPSWRAMARATEPLVGVATKDLLAQFPGEYHCTCLPAPSWPLQC